MATWLPSLIPAFVPQRLASWGYVCILYDKRETVNDPVNDDVTVRLLRELIGELRASSVHAWAQARSRKPSVCVQWTSLRLVSCTDWATTDPALSKLCDTKDVFLVGHSRGAKVSTLAAVSDPRVKALALIDPVDNTQYAPLGPGERPAPTAPAFRSCIVHPYDARHHHCK